LKAYARSMRILTALLAIALVVLAAGAVAGSRRTRH
jgi:hypothetical protein